jgi:hypothetical protein
MIMKKPLSLLITLFVIGSFAMAQEPTLDEILAKHYKAAGYDKLLKTKSIIMSGTMIQQDAMPVKIIRMRPDRYYMEFDVQDITAYQGYDGQTAWMTAPWTGNPKPQEMPEDRAKDMRTKADFDGLLYQWKEKGHLVELAGRDTVGTTLAYKLKVTKKDGGTEYLFIDPSRFIILKRLYFRNIRGKDVPVENYFHDYKAVNGIPFAFTQDTYFGGQPYNSLQIENIELDQPIDSKFFSMPVK